MSLNFDDLYCTNCKKKLTDPKSCVWLELSWKTNRFYLEGVIPTQESQGFFPFGKDCSKKVLKKNEFKND